VDTDTTLANAIQEHLALRERNSDLDGEMALTHYQPDDPFENHPLFKSEEQARLEETLEGVGAPEPARSVLPWPGDDAGELDGAALDDGLWSRSRDFDWGE
jgi:hypothetical protein